MSSLVRSVLGAAVLLTGASAAMAASGTAPVAGQPVQAGASTVAAAPANAPVAYQSVQTGAVAPVAAPAAPKPSNVADKADRYGGYDPNSTAGSRAFWDAINPY